MQGDWRRSQELCETAEAILRERCTGGRWELAASHLYALLSLSDLGDVGQLSRRLPDLIQEARERNDLNALANLCTRLSYIRFLASDDVAGARKEVHEGMAGWSQRRFTAQHYFELHATTEIELYAGDGAAAWSAVEHRWQALERSLLLRVQRVQIEALSLRARAAVAAGVHQTAQRKELLRIADQAIRRMRRTHVPSAVSLADIVEAGCEVTRDRVPEALRLLDAAVRSFTAADMPLHAAATQWRLGQIGPHHQMASADAWMKAHGVSNPRGMADMLAPGAYPTR